MKHALIAIIAALFMSSCVSTAPDSWADKPNPLDSLDPPQTVEQMHADNVKIIIGTAR